MDNFFEERSAAYDHLAKRFLARKSILARILKLVVPEFSECTFEEIEKKYIEGEPILNVDKIPLGEKNTTHELLNLLHLIFMDLKSSGEKEKILRDVYDLEITRNMRKEMAEMGGLIEPLLNIGIKRGVEKAINEAKAKATAEAYKESEKNISLMNIRNLMKNLNLTLQQAMDALGIPADKQDELRPLI